MTSKRSSYAATWPCTIAHSFRSHCSPSCSPSVIIRSVSFLLVIHVFVGNSALLVLWSVAWSDRELTVSEPHDPFPPVDVVRMLSVIECVIVTLLTGFYYSALPSLTDSHP